MNATDASRIDFSINVKIPAAAVLPITVGFDVFGSLFGDDLIREDITDRLDYPGHPRLGHHYAVAPVLDLSPPYGDSLPEPVGIAMAGFGRQVMNVLILMSESNTKRADAIKPGFMPGYWSFPATTPALVACMMEAGVIGERVQVEMNLEAIAGHVTTSFRPASSVPEDARHSSSMRFDSVGMFHPGCLFPFYRLELAWKEATKTPVQLKDRPVKAHADYSASAACYPARACGCSEGGTKVMAGYDRIKHPSGPAMFRATYGTVCGNMQSMSFSVDSGGILPDQDTQAMAREILGE